MLKYLVSLIGIIGALLGFVPARPMQPAPMPRTEPTRVESPGPDAHATMPAVSQNSLLRDPAIRQGIQSLKPVIKKEFTAPIVAPPKIILQIVAPPALVVAASSSPASSTPALSPQKPAEPPLPPLNEKAIFSAVVKIECPSEDRKGRYVASGFAMPHGVIVTAAHLIKDSGSDTCTVIFPRNRAPSIYLLGKTEDREAARRRHDEQGIDVAFIFMPLLAAYPEAHTVFPDAYPFIPYPACADPALLGDAILHFGYPSSFQDNSYLDASEGKAAAYADINGITEELSEDQSYLFKSPVFKYTNDQSQLHPYLVSRSPSFYGDSGGLGFDVTRQCIIGPDRGGTIGGAAGENFSIFMVLGWQGVRSILP